MNGERRAADGELRAADGDQKPKNRSFDGWLFATVVEPGYPLFHRPPTADRRSQCAEPFLLGARTGIKRDSFFGPQPTRRGRTLEESVMSRVCEVTGKRPVTGNRVSHANNRRRRRFLPNLHVHRFWLESERRFVSLRVSTRGLRTIEKRGIDKVVADLRAKGVQV